MIFENSVQVAYEFETGADHRVFLGREKSGVWGQSLHWGPGAFPLISGPGGFAPLKLTIFSNLYTHFSHIIESN